ncbi:hypothetical protein Gotur_025275 [Gossypium turneri]
MATTVVKRALQAIRERGLRSFLRDLKEDGFTVEMHLRWKPSVSQILFLLENLSLKKKKKKKKKVELEVALKWDQMPYSSSFLIYLWSEFMKCARSRSIALSCDQGLNSLCNFIGLISSEVRLHIFIIIIYCIFESNLLDSSRQTKIHNIGATVGGVDKFGNKYYEKLGDTQSG